MNLKIHDFKLQIGVDNEWSEGLDRYQKQAVIQLLKREGFEYHCTSFEYDPDIEYFIFQKRVFNRNDEISPDKLPSPNQVLKHLEAWIIVIKNQIIGPENIGDIAPGLSSMVDEAIGGD